MAGVRKGRGRELGRETTREGGGRRFLSFLPRAPHGFSRAQIPPSPFNACLPRRLKQQSLLYCNGCPTVLLPKFQKMKMLKSFFFLSSSAFIFPVISPQFAFCFFLVRDQYFFRSVINIKAL